MDLSRNVLDNLMGRDRNLSKNSKHARDHYTNSDVCKPFLVCFCFNTLFPNTIYDEGPCNKRHDTYLKTMFDNDINRSEHERQYIRQCIYWIQKRLVDAEQKTKKNQNVIDNKSNFPTERPKQILDRVIAIDKDIEDMMEQAQAYGENGQIDDSSRCLEEVQRLRERRKEIQSMSDNMLTIQKQQKICETCGAIQTINDTEKRIQMHLEGKIHQGFLKLRNQIQTLKIRLEIIQHKTDAAKPKQIHKEKEKEEHLTKEVFKEKEKYNTFQVKQDSKQKIKDKQRSPSHKKKKQHRDRSREKEKIRQKERQPEYRDKQRKQNKERREKSSQKRYKHDRSRERERSRDKHKEKREKDNKQHKKKHKKDRSRSYEKEYRQKSGF